MAVRLCTGCTVCRGAMDGKERRMSMDGGVAMSIRAPRSNTSTLPTPTLATLSLIPAYKKS